MTTCTSHQVFFIHMQPKPKTPISREEANFGLYEDQILILKEQNIEGDHKNFEGKRLDTESRVKNGLAGRIP